MRVAFDMNSTDAPGSADAIAASIIEMEKERQRLQRQIDAAWNPLLKLRLNDAYEIIATIDHPDAPQMGQKFLDILQDTSCTVKANPFLEEETLAAYNAYCTGSGWLNTMDINPMRLVDFKKFQMQDVLILCNSILHEGAHAAHNSCAPVMKHSPCNPATNVILHPVSWIKAVIASERDAYRIQGMGSALLVDNFPAIRELTKNDLLSVDDFERTAGDYGYNYMGNRVVRAALDALSKEKTAGMTFENDYQRSTLEIYRGALLARNKNGETKRLYVQAEAQDIWQIGNHGLGPNSFGEYVREPLLLGEPELRPTEQALLSQICKEFRIPPQEECMTLQQYHESSIPVPERRSWASSALGNLLDAARNVQPVPQAFA